MKLPSWIERRKCAIIWWYPVYGSLCSAGKDTELFLSEQDLDTWNAMVGSIREMIKEGTTFVMVSQCLHGRVCDRVYDTGRDLLSAGVIEGEDMLPEVALVKLMWVLGNSSSQEEVRRMMGSNLAGEIKWRSSE